MNCGSSRQRNFPHKKIGGNIQARRDILETSFKDNIVKGECNTLFYYRPHPTSISQHKHNFTIWEWKKCSETIGHLRSTCGLVHGSVIWSLASQWSHLQNHDQHPQAGYKQRTTWHLLGPWTSSKTQEPIGPFSLHWIPSIGAKWDNVALTSNSDPSHFPMSFIKSSPKW